MSLRAKAAFDHVRTEGGLLTPDLLRRVGAFDKKLPGMSPAAYHLGEGERLADAVNRSWLRLKGTWDGFQTALAKRPSEDAASGLTREKWLGVLLQELGYGRLPRVPSTEIEGKAYPISHFAGAVPVHQLGFRVGLDRRTPGVEGAAKNTPHGLVQEFLNRSDEHLWGMVTNGRALRLLRDHASLTRQAYVEFDLEGIFAGEAYPDFKLLWLVAHQSRVEHEKPEECWLEQWKETARAEGTRVLERLRTGVEQAIESLGKGFLEHPANNDLRDALRAGRVSTHDYYRQLLRVAYRLIFVFVAEDRGLLLVPDGSDEAKDRYLRHYATDRLRRMSRRRRGSRHHDQWRMVRFVFDCLDEGEPALALPGLGSFLWSRDATRDLRGAELSNARLLDAIHRLCWAELDSAQIGVKYAEIGPEELGSVYESLLELHLDVDAEGGGAELSSTAGHDRKTTGSYYTPHSLVQCLLDSALDPVLDEACAKPDPAEALLALKVCDPACGSGHFLIAAAHRIARRLASVRSGDEEPSPEATRAALRDVVGHCLYGVDKNDMAVELCKVNLWMEALDPGRPLSFLDAHVQHGDALLGTTPGLMAGGIPDLAFAAIEGDDKEVVNGLRKQNREERKVTADGAAKSQRTMFAGFGAAAPIVQPGLARAAATIDARPDGSLDQVRATESA